MTVVVSKQNTRNEFKFSVARGRAQTPSRAAQDAQSYLTTFAGQSASRTDLLLVAKPNNPSRIHTTHITPKFLF